MFQQHSLKRWDHFCTADLASSGCPFFPAANHPRRYCVHPEYLLHSKYVPLRTSSHHILHFLPARSLITMFHPQTTQMKLSLLLVLLLYSATKRNILTPGTKPVALLLMSCDKEVNPGDMKTGPQGYSSQKSTTQSLFIFNLIFF